ncbi:hypothetical protein MHU86_8492 [Fragilaria crotonensis]|nr:hypothetical protein MHU86_8492 [Fragilaria crotonensis]
MVDVSSNITTAFSRVSKPRRKVFGAVGDEVESETLLTASDLLPADGIGQETKNACLLGDDEEFEDAEEHDCTDEDVLNVNPTDETKLPETLEDDKVNDLQGGLDEKSVNVSPTKALVSTVELENATSHKELSLQESENDETFFSTTNASDDAETIENTSDQPADDVTPRRSKRTHKPTNSALDEPAPSSTKKQSEPLLNTLEDHPDDDDLIASIDGLFVHADKETVTVKDIVVALEAEYGITLAKTTKIFVRNHLKNLVQGTVEPTVAVGSDGEEKSDEEVEEDDDTSEPDFEADNQEDSSDYEQEDKKPKRKSKISGIKKESEQKRKSTRRSTKAKKPSATRIHAEMLRKKRMDELRVRQEELQMQQNKEDQERAEQIAARFNTNTEELKLKRLEDRLDLLQKLDQKRIQVVTGENILPKGAEVEKGVPPAAFTSDSDSDSDMELEIVDRVHQETVESTATEKSNGTTGSDAQLKALSILTRISSAHASVVEKKQISWSEVALSVQSSPGKSLSARASLRRTLLSKQRKMGNLWLARELGYNSEQDHLRDCRQAEEVKRNQVIKLEEARLKANGRKQLRERMLIASEEAVGTFDDEGEEEWKPSEASSQDNDDEDEELALAKAIEEEDDVDVDDDDDDANKASEEKDLPSDHDQESDVDADVDDDDEELSLAVENEAADGTKLDQHVVLEQRLEQESSDEAPEMKEVGTGHSESSAEALIVGAPPRRESENMNNVDKVDFDAGEEEESQAEAVASQVPLKSPSAPRGASGGTKDSSPEPEEPAEKVKKAKNSGWQEMLRKEAEQLKKLKGRKGSGLVEAEADEEEEEDVVAGLEDFGFSMGKKKKEDDEEEEVDDELDEEDLKHVVDELSDDEGDEEAGERARKELMKREEKEKHKEMMRRMREGYDGRRGGIAGGGSGARGLHRFDQLVAADNREDAKRLGLLNDDELDSEDEDGEQSGSVKDNDDADDEVALLDKMLKDRFLHRSSGDIEEHFSDDDEDDNDVDPEQERLGNDEDAEEREQERLAKRFAKRARMQRLLEAHGEDEEFSQLRLIDEDQRMKEELMSMKDVAGLSRRQYSASSNSQSAFSNSGGDSHHGSSSNSQSLFAIQTSGSLVLALKACHQRKNKTSFLGGSAANKDKVSAIHKSVALNHVVFHSENSHSRSSVAPVAATGKRKRALQTSSSLWDKVASNSFRQKKRH